MKRFHIKGGAKATGVDVDLHLDARDNEEALAEMAHRGVLVSSITEVSEKEAREADVLRKICLDCGAWEEPVEIRPGKGFIEIILWVLGVLSLLFYGAALPVAVFYSVVRSHGSYQACPKCLSRRTAPIESPMAREIYRKYHSGN
jgi:hypothetical protein